MAAASQLPLGLCVMYGSSMQSSLVQSMWGRKADCRDLLLAMRLSRGLLVRGDLLALTRLNSISHKQQHRGDFVGVQPNVEHLSATVSLVK
mmetsp:Transcript_18003/g.37212  ORF Transcript_18003/g.37212 Transcript_18003/m.37212 type:complete len:91 (+) Transcript_18003:506-778(+)